MDQQGEDNNTQIRSCPRCSTVQRTQVRRTFENASEQQVRRMFENAPEQQDPESFGVSSLFLTLPSHC